MGVAFISGLEQEQNDTATGMHGQASSKPRSPTDGIVIAALVAGHTGLVVLRALKASDGSIGRDHGVTEHFLGSAMHHGPDLPPLYGQA